MFRYLSLTGVFLFILFFQNNTLAVTLFHPVHISVVNMDLEEDGSLIFSVKLFVDDFQEILNKKNNTSLEISKEMEIKNLEPYLTAYVFENLQIVSKQELQQKDYSFEKFELKDKEIWLYYKVKVLVKEDLSINNSLMCDLYQDQTNLFILSYQGKDKAFSFNFKKRSNTFILN